MHEQKIQDFLLVRQIFSVCLSAELVRPPHITGLFLVAPATPHCVPHLPVVRSPS